MIEYRDSYGGVYSSLSAAPWEGTRRGSKTGNSGAGRRPKKAQKEGRTIVFIDESGLSQRPHRRRTWAPRGQTPVLQFHFQLEDLVGRRHLVELYPQIFERTIKSEQIIEFLKHLLRYIPGDILLMYGPQRTAVVPAAVACSEDFRTSNTIRPPWSRSPGT